MSLELTTQEALTLAPNLIPAILQALQEDIPEELQDRILEEMNQRAQRALEILPEGDRLSLTQALQRRISSTPTPAHPLMRMGLSDNWTHPTAGIHPP